MTQDREQAEETADSIQNGYSPELLDCLLINVPASTPGLLSWLKHRVMGREEKVRKYGKLNVKTILQHALGT